MLDWVKRRWEKLTVKTINKVAVSINDIELFEKLSAHPSNYCYKTHEMIVITGTIKGRSVAQLYCRTCEKVVFECKVRPKL